MSTNQDYVEYEAKILDIDKQEIVAKLMTLGATKVAGYDFKRYVFDTIPVTPGRWVRLRSDGTQTTLTVKEIIDDSIDGTHEWEITVSDIDTCLKILEKIGLSPRGYQENTRTEYRLDGIEISIDSWPRLNPYVEIEGKSKDEVLAMAAKLGYEAKDLTSRNTEALYVDQGIDLKDIKELTFKEKK